MVLIAFVAAFSVYAQETEGDIKERADKLFEKEQYVEATKDYLHLLSLNPMSHDYNFRYGACLLYNSQQKDQGMRYLNYAILSETIDPRAFYFRGRALHLNYQFTEAIRDYTTYKKKSGGKKDKRYPVDRDIQMCHNGQHLLTTFTDIVVAEKKQIDESKFYDLYLDQSTIGGDILPSVQFQSKLDKKQGHVPVVHYGPNADAIYYASYGDDLSTGLDIFVRRRLPDGGWGDPQPVPGSINTNEDENYPYMHPSGQFLYFSSMGHNSMGGYDIFMSKLDVESYNFGPPENVDFAISSPDDDLFYVVDEAFENAYFASARQSQAGMLHVYKVKVVRVPIQDVIVMGDFLSEINPDNKDMEISVTSYANNEPIGKIKSNAKGKYSFVFPQGGKYEYLIDVEGSEKQYKYVVELPFLDELRPLKQKVLHTTEDGEEIVKLINLFDESVEGAEALIAGVIRKKSELNVNIDQYDLEQLAQEEKQKEILASLGFEGMQAHEVSNQLNDLVEDIKSNNETKKRIQANIDHEILLKAKRIAELDAIEKELVEKAMSTDDPVLKYKLLNEAEQKSNEKKVLISTVNALQKMKEDVANNAGLSESEIAKIEDLTNEFNELVASNQKDEAMTALAENAEVLANAKSGSTDDMMQKYLDEAKELKTKLNKEKDTEYEFDRLIEKLNADILTLESKLADTGKKKEREELEQQIAEKNTELNMVNRERDRTRDNIDKLNHQISVVENQIASLSNAIETETAATIDEQELEMAVADVQDVENQGDPVDYIAEIETIRETNPEVEGGTPVTQQFDIEAFRNENELEKDGIRNDAGLTELEKVYREEEANLTTLSDIEDRLQKVADKLEKNPSNEKLLKEKESLLDYQAELLSENKELNARADELKSEVPDVALSKEDIESEIDPTYLEDVASIQNDPGLSEKERAEQTKEKQEEFLTKAESELETVESSLKDDPENSELQAQKELLEEIVADTERDIKQSEENILAMENNVAVTEEPVVIKTEDIYPKYQDKVEEIENNEELSAIEKQEQLQQEDERLLDKANSEKTSLTKKLSKDPENQELVKEIAAMESFISEVENRITERDQTIAALNNTEVQPETKVTTEDVLTSVDPQYETKLEEIKNSGSPNATVEIMELESELLTNLNERKDDLEKEVESDPSKQTEQDIVNQLIEEKENELVVLKTDYVESLSEEEKDELITDVYSDYQEDINAAEQLDEPERTERLIEIENELQATIEDHQKDNEKALNRKYSVRVDLNDASYDKILTESKLREEALVNADVVVETPTKEKEAFIEELRLSQSDPEILDKEFTSAEELKEQDEQLAAYEEKLEERVVELESDPEIGTSQEKQQELNWVKEELDEVKTKRRAVKISIGELETSAITETNVGNENELAELEKEEAVIKEKLRDDNLSSTDRKNLEKALDANREEQTSKENELYETKIENDTKETEENVAVLTEIAAEDPQVEKSLKSIEAEQQDINQLKEEAEKARSEEEKNYLLEEAAERQEELNRNSQEVLEEVKLAEIEEQNNVKINTKEELESKKRKFTIRIGEVTKELIDVDEQLTSAKRKEIPELEEKKANLEAEKESLQARLNQVDEQLAQYEESAPTVSNEALKEVITFNEERELASSEEYKEYEEVASEALAIEEQITNLEDELKDEQDAVVRLTNEGAKPDSPEIKERVENIKSIQEDIDRLNIELVQKKFEANERLPEDKEEAMKMQNLALRGVKPIAKVAVATTLIALPANGLAIDTTTSAESAYSEANPIPVDVASPSGLVYRVQVGAFARPIPQNLYKEFNPVSGEKIDGTNITRYMAGFFNNSEDVVKAREQIRDLGYSDAFVVAYCDGERVSFWQARQLEQSGECVPQGANDLMVEVATKTAESLGLPTTDVLPEVAEMDYNKAPGAAPADPIERMKGLFFTVQIGVFNRPIGKEYLHDMTEILTIRLPNGQIRYASGKFDSVEEALPRRNLALANGVKGAFVTAYYEGERIPLWKAKQILAEKGPSILQSNMDKVAEPVVEETDTLDYEVEVPRTDTVSNVNVIADNPEVIEMRVQVVTKKQFEEYPRDVLNRYNAEGSFYFDVKDRRVKSIIYRNEDYLPRLYNFRDDIDTVYIEAGALADELTQIIEVTFADSTINGDFMDWILRFNYRRDFVQSPEGVIVRIFGVEEEKMNETLNVIKGFGVEPVVRKETELELELEENQE